MDKSGGSTSTFLTNLRWVARRRRIVGKVEAQAGVCPGYLRRSTHTAGMSLQTACNLANAVGYKMDDLLDPEFIAKQLYAEVDADVIARAHH